MKIFKKILLVVVLGIMVIMIALPAFGQSGSTVDERIIPLADELGAPITNYEDTETLLKSIISWVYTIFFIVAVLFILLAAYNYLLGGSDEKKVALAKQQLKYAVIAVVIALVASGISGIISTFIGAAV